MQSSHRKKAPQFVTHSLARMATGDRDLEQLALEALQALPEAKHHVGHQHFTSGSEVERRALATKRELRRIRDQVKEKKALVEMLKHVPALRPRLLRETKKLRDLLDERTELKDLKRTLDNKVVDRLLRED